MYRDNIALDPSSLPRGYGGSSAGAGVLYFLADPLEAYLPGKDGNLQEISPPCAICRTEPATRASIRH
jgi:hypothetical protein